MKKIGLTLILVLIMLFALVGCGSGNDGYVEDETSFTTIEKILEDSAKLSKSNSQASDIQITGTPNFNVPASGYDGSEVTITFYHTMGSNLRDVLKTYIEDFNVLYPNIHISEDQVGGYNDVRDTIQKQLSVGKHPNIAYCYPDHVATYNILGAVATLDNLINSQIEVTRADGSTEILGLTQDQINDFIEGYYLEGRQFGDGLMYTMPFSKSTEVLYYNKTFFTEHEIPLPDHWFSTSESDTTSMEAVCKKIKEIDSKSIPLGYDSEANWFITLAEQTNTPYTTAVGNKLFLFNNANNRTMMKAIREWYQNAWVTTQELYGSYTSGLFIERAADKSRSYMSIGSSAGATHQRPDKENGAYPFEVGIAPIPQMNQNYRKVISQGPSVCIFKSANPQEVIASWLFVKFLTTSPEFQGEFSRVSGYIPVLKSVKTLKFYADFLANADGYDYIAALSAKVCLEQEDAYYTSPAFNGSSTARDQVGILLQRIISTKTNDVDDLVIESFRDAIAKCRYAVED